MEPLAVAEMNVAAGAVHENVDDARGIQVKEVAAFMRAEQVAAGRHQPNAAHTVKTVGFCQRAVSYSVGIAIPEEDVAAPRIAAGGVEEINFVGPAIGGEDIVVGVHDKIAELVEVVVQGRDPTGWSPLFHFFAGSKVSERFILFHPTAP